MAYTRAQLRTAVLQAADAVSSPRWDTTVGGEVDRTITKVFDKEWKRILNANRFFRMRKVSTTTDSNGRIPLTALSDTATADNHKRLYRILAVVVDSIEYDKSEFDRHVLSEEFDFIGRIWYREGTSLFLLPKKASAAADVWVNYIPTKPLNLSGEAVAIDFPEDYEDLLKYEAAAWLKLKGGAETNAAVELKTFASDIRDDMLQDLARDSIDPDQVRYGDTASEWGG